MDADKLAKLRAIAEKADRNRVVDYVEFERVFNPSVVKALLDVVEAASKARDEVDIDRALAALAEKIR